MGLKFVGFNGRPVAGAAGLKAPLVFDEDSRRYALLRKQQLGAWHSEEEIHEHEERMLLTRLPSSAPYDADGIALYAHTEFAAPHGAASELGVRPLPVGGELSLQPSAESFVAFVKRDEARLIMRRWGDFLLRAARDALALDTSEAHQGQLAYTEAMRARFVFPMAEGHPDERCELFALACVGLRLQQRNEERLLADANLEGLREEVLRRSEELQVERRAAAAAKKTRRSRLFDSPGSSSRQEIVL
jgi:hypothetical protein